MTTEPLAMSARSLDHLDTLAHRQLAAGAVGITARRAATRAQEATP